MSTEISKLDKFKPIPKEVAAKLKENEITMSVGDVYIYTDPGREANVIRIVDFETYKGDFHGKKYTEAYIVYQEASDWEVTKWDKKKKMSVSDWKNYYKNKYIKIPEDQTIAQYIQEARGVIEGKIGIDFYKDQNSDSLNNDTSLMSRNATQSLQVLQNELELKRSRAELIRTFVGLEMEKRRRELEKVREKMLGVVAEFKKKMEKIMKVITTIELYLGIDEELFQIQDGEKASPNEPIQFRQMVYFMDEEIGHWKDGGLDFQDIKWFDEWLMKDGNYKRLLPEKKGVMVFRPRRYNKEYKGYDPEVAAEMNRMNRMTYLLIRNGDCLYRVYTEKIRISPRLFPQRKELQELLETLEGEMKKEGFWSDKKNQEEAEDLIYQYKKRAILMQGLIDRTEVFNPIAKQVSMFKMYEAEGLINFIYDDEATLPSGRLSFKKWKDLINSKIQPGSRILCTGAYGSREDYRDRIYYYCNEHNAPDTPDEGVFSVEKYDQVTTEWLQPEEFEKLKTSGKPFTLLEENEKKWTRLYDDWRERQQDSNLPDRYDIKGYKVKFVDEHLTILHNPGGTVYGSWGDYDPHDRKKRIRFRIYPSDSAILNYDQIDLDDINFYLTSRVDRPNYLHMMPLLEKIKANLLKEKESEKHFVRFLHDRNASFLESKKVNAWEAIITCIDWWKFKNKWKRAIAKDDTLALRMIEKRLRSKDFINSLK